MVVAGEVVLSSPVREARGLGDVLMVVLLEPEAMLALVLATEPRVALTTNMSSVPSIVMLAAVVVLVEIDQ